MPKIEIDGFDLFYKIVGDGHHTVLCLPDFLGTTETDFGAFLEKADKELFRFVLWDPPGYGQSYPPERDFSRGWLQRDAELVGKLMKALEIPKYSVFGWGQGGATGIHLAAGRYSPVDRLVLLAPEARFTNESGHHYLDVSTIDFKPTEELTTNPTDSQKCFLWGVGCIVNKLTTLLKYHTKEYLKKVSVEMANACINSRTYEKSGRYLGDVPSKVARPTLILHGEDDISSCVEQSKEMHKLIVDAELHVFDKGKHDVHLTHTDEFYAEFERFLL